MPTQTYLISSDLLDDIANAIRAKNGSEATYTPAQMATAINNLSVGEGGGNQQQGLSPVTVNITQSDHQTITVVGSITNSTTLTSSGTISVPSSVTFNATLVADNGYDAGTLNQSTATANWGDTVSFYASEATAAAGGENWQYKCGYSDETLNGTSLSLNSRLSTYKIDQQVTIGEATTLKVELEFHTDAPLAFDPLEGFEFASQAKNHNNAAWGMADTDCTPLTESNQITTQQAELQTWCENGTHGSCWNVQVGDEYVTKICWTEPLSGITWAEWIDGKPNTGRKFFAGGVRFTTTGANIKKYYHRFYFDAYDIYGLRPGETPYISDIIDVLPLTEGDDWSTNVTSSTINTAVGINNTVNIEYTAFVPTGCDLEYGPEFIYYDSNGNEQRFSVTGSNQVMHSATYVNGTVYTYVIQYTINADTSNFPYYKQWGNNSGANNVIIRLRASNYLQSVSPDMVSAKLYPWD